MSRTSKPVDVIHIENATENNLDHVTLDIPKYAFVVVTGPSGSGKSTLAFDTLYMESRRRFLDTLSMYARQFVGAIKRPSVERVTGLTPSIAVVQGTLSHNPRSTVGTVTEVYDYIRLLWGRAGVQICPSCHIEVSESSRATILARLMAWPERTKAIIYAPLIRQRKGRHADLLLALRHSGFSRVRIDGQEVSLDHVEGLNENVRHTIEVVIDRVVIRPDRKDRIAEAIAHALEYGNGQCLVERLFDNAPSQMSIFSEKATCPRCGMSFPELSPDMLAFNKPLGACEFCHGSGSVLSILPETLLGDTELPIYDKAKGVSALSPMAAILDLEGNETLCKAFAKCINAAKRAYNLNLKKPFSSFSEDDRSGFLAELVRQIGSAFEALEGSDPLRSVLEPYMLKALCPQCGGCRLNVYARNVHFCGTSLGELQMMTVDQAIHFFEHLRHVELDTLGARLLEDLLPSLLERLRFVSRVGLGYLQLHRGAVTLSGGEAQRIRLAGLLGNGLTAVTYILDEPSIGLHARDQARLIGVLQELRDRGNTVIAVEHDDATMRACDHLVDIGPHAGRLGGQVIYSGPIETIAKVKNSLTIDYLLGRRTVEIPAQRRLPSHGWITLHDAWQNNLKHIDVSIPLGCIVCVTGVSGSGKSTLVNELLLPALHAQLAGTSAALRSPKGSRIEGLEQIGRVLEVDQKPIGKTPRSNPATYTKVFDHIRTLFAALPEAKMYGYNASRFSFNVSNQKNGGRCESCSGAGVRTIEMRFLSDTYVECEECHGRRFNDSTLRVRYNGYNIADVLAMSFEDAANLFEGQIKISRILRAVCDVGLGYIKLGQPSPTLSGGESQRLKLSREIAKTSRTPTLFVFDEPSTGLHADDVAVLVRVFSRLADMGHSVVIIEHNLDIIKTSDYLIDIGPEPGDAGGEIVVTGTPEQVAACERSHTGRYLRPLLG